MAENEILNKYIFESHLLAYKNKLAGILLGWAFKIWMTFGSAWFGKPNQTTSEKWRFGQQKIIWQKIL